MKKIILFLFLLPFFLPAQSPGSEESKKTAKEKLENIRQRALKGESFAELARKNSEDPGSASNGGMYAHVKRGVMVAEFENVAFSLKVGDISEVFETQFGFHIIQLQDKKGDEVDLRHILIVPK
jgi:peptidyl-prolyl cis-trans isomerase SurA